MTGRTQMTRDQGPQTGQPNSISFDRCTEKRRKGKDPIDDVARSPIEGVIDMMGTMTDTCEEGGVREVGSSVVA